MSYIQSVLVMEGHVQKRRSILYGDSSMAPILSRYTRSMSLGLTGNPDPTAHLKPLDLSRPMYV